jgi:hypothetical protein
VRLQGERNKAFEPALFEYPGNNRFPAYVLAIAVDISTLRIKLLPISDTNANTPLEEMAIPRGVENAAFVAIPLLLPEVPFPTKVVTVAVERIILRTKQ